MKYPKVYRIPITGVKVRGKRYLTAEQVAELLADEVTVEEKLDGKTFSAALSPVVEGYTVFYEFLKWRHTIRYTALPAWNVAFDLYSDYTRNFVASPGKNEILQRYGWTTAPVIYVGKIEKAEDLLRFLGKPSAFGAPKIEGIVIKNYAKQLFAKVVDPEFEEAIDTSEHWMKRKKEMNRLKI